MNSRRDASDPAAFKPPRWVSPWSFEDEWLPPQRSSPPAPVPLPVEPEPRLPSAFESRALPATRPVPTLAPVVTAKQPSLVEDGSTSAIPAVVSARIKSFADYGRLSEHQEPQTEGAAPPLNKVEPPKEPDVTRFQPPAAAKTASVMEERTSPISSTAKVAPGRMEALPTAAPAKIETPSREAVTRSPATRPGPRPTSLQKRQPQDFSWLTPIILCLGLLSFVLLAWIYMTDIQPETDEDLQIPVPVDQAVWIAAPERMRVFLDAVVRIDKTGLARTPAWDWDTPSLATFVNANATAFSNLRDLLEDFDWHPHHASWHAEDLGEHESWPFVRILLQAHAAYMVRRGDDESALTTTLDIAELSRRMMEIWAWPSFMQRSQEMHLACTQTAAEILKQTRLSSARLKSFQEEFMPCAPSDTILQGAMSAFYMHEKKLIFGEKSGVPLDTLPGGVTQERPGRVFFKKHETLSLFANAYRHLRDEAVIAPFAAQGKAARSIRLARKALPQYFQPNGSGELYFTDHIEPFLIMPERHSLAKTRHQLVTTLFAIRRYVVDHQKLPASLTELLPNYLIDIPMDPFSGEPLRYDPLKGWIYSVGTNYRDEKGRLTQPPMLDASEITLELGIAVAAPVPVSQ